MLRTLVRSTLLRRCAFPSPGDGPEPAMPTSSFHTRVVPCITCTRSKLATCEVAAAFVEPIRLLSFRGTVSGSSAVSGYNSICPLLSLRVVSLLILSFLVMAYLVFSSSLSSRRGRRKTGAQARNAYFFNKVIISTSTF